MVSLGLKPATSSALHLPVTMIGRCDGSTSKQGDDTLQRLTLKSGKVPIAILKGEEFVAASMSGVRIPPDHYYNHGGGRLEGFVRTSFHRKRNTELLIYVVLSYETPIAWYAWTSGETKAVRSWYVVTDKFSHPTTRHQNLVQEAMVWVPNPIYL